MASSQDGHYIFIGMPDGLVALNANTHQTVTQWKEDGMEITTIQISGIGEQIYMIATLDDFGMYWLSTTGCIFKLQ